QGGALLENDRVLPDGEILVVDLNRNLREVGMVGRQLTFEDVAHAQARDLDPGFGDESGGVVKQAPQLVAPRARGTLPDPLDGEIGPGKHRQRQDADLDGIVALHGLADSLKRTAPEVSTNSRKYLFLERKTSSRVPLTTIFPSASMEMRSPIRNTDIMSCE